MPNATVRASARSMPAERPDVDPAFAAIERHRAASKPYAAALRRSAGLLCPLMALAAEVALTSAAEIAAGAELFATTPTTPAGLGAILAYVAALDVGSLPDEPDELRAFIAALARSPLFAVFADR